MLFEHPFTAIVSGPTKAGKTVLVEKLVRHKDSLIHPPPERVIWCYGEYQRGYEELAKLPYVELVEGLPDIAMLKATSDQPKLVVCDDLMSQAKKTDLTTLFSRGSHHWNLSIIHIVQNLFFDGLRTARINAHYLILMKNPSDQLQVATLARQMYPHNARYLQDAYKDACCSQQYGYLVIDSNPKTEENFRLKTNIFPDELLCVYLPKQ
jgi:hypothetical protein